MNYLAHLLLAEDEPVSRVGNLLGDFVSGRPETLQLPPRLVQGIIRHRAIDRFADDHLVTARLMALVAPERRRFAGVIVDVTHDHFLTMRWHDYSPIPLQTFINDCNQALRDHAKLLPPALADTLEDRIADNWLGRYGTEGGLDAAFQRISRRHHRFLPIGEAIEDVRRYRAEFEAGFIEFFPELQAWVRDLGPEAKVVIDRGSAPA